MFVLQNLRLYRARHRGSRKKAVGEKKGVATEKKVRYPTPDASRRRGAYNGVTSVHPTNPQPRRRRPMTTVAAPSKSAKKLPVKVRQTKMLIDGKWLDSTSGKTFETINPATGEPIANVAEGD